MIGFGRQPDLHGFLAAHQREADEQAARWIERELRRALAPKRTPLDDYRARQNERRESWLGLRRA